ncbi:MAG TPA: PSD1 and planctomycete cytochrome C domain-containing protein [Gemmataceae bacterium]|nr:PSD1 and planctomycete cytochrome C domain-containing protein [Gemmataceae bacterium]
MIFLPILLILVAGPSAAEEPRPTPEQVQFFEAKVRPLLFNHCQRCHGPEKQSSGLRLDSAAAVRKGGDSGPVLVPGKPEESRLIRAVRRRDETLQMPPKEPLKPEEVAILTEWVRMGAPWPEAPASTATRPDIDTARRNHWSFRPLAEVRIPEVRDVAWPLNEVDRFILAQLEAQGLTPVEPADKRTLIRRVTFDLIGLPPTPEEIAAFEADSSPDAFARVVDRLLASPHYGERWGRHWLDVVRYADTAGDNSDYPVPQLYKYRNWVIQAFNQDKPYDQFLREQIAGDLLPARDDQDRYDKLIATGYLANSRRFGSYEDARYQWYLTYEDTIDNLGRTILGLTISCARCHDHKFDPITTEDYYALYGFFQSTRYPWPGTELSKAPYDLVPLVPPEVSEPVMKERQAKLAVFDAEIQQLEKAKAAVAKAVKEAEAALPSFSEESDGKEEGERRLAEARQQFEELTKAVQAAKIRRERFAKTPLPFETAYAVAEGTRWVGNARIQIKGDPGRLGPEVPRRFLTVLGGQVLPAGVKGSGRLELAGWLTDPHNPLTARVMVNRIWQYHFGRGIVATPSDFGVRGEKPTHPELLDWLARRFIDSGWSIKAMHRLIVLSRTYQLSSRDHPANAMADPGNTLRWRYNRHRLDAESIRDAMLAVSGGLDRSPGGPHPFPNQTTWDFTQHKPFKAVYETNRRSVYLMTQRIQRHPYLALFDGPDTNASTAVRLTSTTPLQALFLFNDPFVHEQARKFAARLLAEYPEDTGRIERAYLLAFGRPATAAEHAAGKSYLARVRAKLASTGVVGEEQTAAAWESYVRAILMANEFVYVN